MRLPMRLSADVIVLDVAGFRRCICRGRSHARQRRNRLDESAIQRSDAASRLAGQSRARSRMWRLATTLESWIHAARRILKSEVRADADLARRWHSPRCWRRSTAASAASQILPVHADVTTPAIRILIRAIKGGRAPTANPREPCCSMMSQACLINRCRRFWRGRDIAALADV